MKTLNGAAAPCLGGRLRLAVAAALAALSLAACASVEPQFAVSRVPARIDPPAAEAQAPPPAVEAAAPATPKARADARGRNGGRYKVGAPYRVAGVLYLPAEQPDYDEVGIASWYGDEFDGRRTANGERFDMYSASAAHTTLPMPSIVEVTNLENGRSIRVRLNDRGPFKAGRIIDLSRGAARELGYMNKGLARVRVRYVGPARLDGSVEPLYVAQRTAPATKPTLQLASARGPSPLVQAVWRTKAPAGAQAPMVLAEANAKLAPLW